MAEGEGMGAVGGRWTKDGGQSGRFSLSALRSFGFTRIGDESGGPALTLARGATGSIAPLVNSALRAFDWAEGRSRVAYLLLGHGPSAYGDANYRRLLANAIRWAAGKQGTPPNSTSSRPSS